MPPGGSAGPGTELSTKPGVFGLAFEGATLYADTLSGDVDQINTTTGAISRTLLNDSTALSIASSAEGIAVDPLTGDLFLSDTAAQDIVRVSNPGSASPTASIYASGEAIDGISFGPGGILYAAGGNDPSTGSEAVWSVTGTNVSGPLPKSFTEITPLPVPDGTAVGTWMSGSYLAVNRNDGIITKVDLSTSPPTLTNIVINGTRGDFETVGADGCLYATQTDLIEKVTNADGSCSFTPPFQLPEAPLAIGLPLMGFAILGGAFIWSRRRRTVPIAL